MGVVQAALAHGHHAQPRELRARTADQSLELRPLGLGHLVREVRVAADRDADPPVPGRVPQQGRDGARPPVPLAGLAVVDDSPEKSVAQVFSVKLQTIREADVSAEPSPDEFQVAVRVQHSSFLYFLVVVCSGILTQHCAVQIIIVYVFCQSCEFIFT